MKLVIVESPTKARTIRRFLPNEYKVEASMGHVRDLPASAAEIPTHLRKATWARLGVHIENDFEPLYITSPNKRSVVSKLQSALKEAEELYIATDEDREGESIGWHLIEVLNPSVPVRRMVFHEITKNAIERALQETRDIDQNLVEAQETRRVLDRLVGYTISPLLWKKIAPKLSAGRVQSVAVRLLVLREQDRLRFVTAEYFDLLAQLSKNEGSFEATMTHYRGIRLATGRDFDAETGTLGKGLVAGNDLLLLNEAEAREIATEARQGTWVVDRVEERLVTRTPSPPFTTSTLQQEASRKLGLSAKQTMRIAQSLYEQGYITYIRTDSTNLSSEAIDASRDAIKRRYGEEYLNPQPRRFKQKARNVQEAHEAIRPAGTLMQTREHLGLKGQDGALYDLIWKRTVATQMADARLKFISAFIKATVGDKEASFRATGRTTLFPGFFRAYVEGSDDPEAALDSREQPLPPLTEGDRLDCGSVEARGHETKPPARYTEASLVKQLERDGIGRPSTYASILDTITQRGYARKKGNMLIPTFTAFATNNLLEQQFAQLVDTEFTANMETALDDIANGELQPTPYLKTFYSGDEGIESRVEDGLEDINAREISTIRANKWGPYLVRVGRYGPYVAGDVSGELRTASLPEDLAPADITREMLEQLLEEENRGDKQLGHLPGTDQVMLLKQGPYGPYVQLGEDEDQEKPKRVSLPKTMQTAEVTSEVAAALLSLPRNLGKHPETGDELLAHIGRYGPYVRHKSTFASIPKGENVLEISFDRALTLIRQKEEKNKPLRELGPHPETGHEITIYQGRYGPYVKHQKTNASLAKTQHPDTITLKEAIELLTTREKTKKGSRGKTRQASRKDTSKTRAAKKSKKATSSNRPKATPEQLAAFLDKVEPQVAEVIQRLEGMGRSKQDAMSVGVSLGLEESEVKKLHKKGMFQLRMAYGRSLSRREGT
ncbi:MAG: type I DNA topoisomerase [Trueperaceae bacterium]|nr:MAG: type I DNA topoisomerase [Trueperaceae bacterium]